MKFALTDMRRYLWARFQMGIREAGIHRKNLWCVVCWDGSQWHEVSAPMRLDLATAACDASCREQLADEKKQAKERA